MKIKDRKRILLLLASSSIVLANTNVPMVFASDKVVDANVDSLEDEIIEYDDFIEEEYVLSENYVVEDFEGADGVAKARTNVVLDAKKYGGLKGDGSDESKKMQSMFDKIKKEYSNTNVTIKFPAGKYHTKKPITVYSNMTVEGVKGKTFMKNTVRGVVFLNGKKDGSYKGNAGSNITFKNLTFKNSRAMSVAHGKNITIENIDVIDGPNNHSIEVAACSNVVIKNSTFSGMNLNDTSEFMKGRDFNEFIQIDRIIQPAFPHFGSYNDADYQAANNGVTIKNCTFEPSKNHAYPVAIGTHGNLKNDVINTTGLVIKGCTFKGATKAAINFPGIGDMKIENNTFSDMNNGIIYESQMKKYEANKVVIKNNKFNNVKNGIEIQMYKPSKKLGELSIKENVFNRKNEGGTAINLKGTDKIKKLNEEKNTITGYKKDIVRVANCEDAPVVKSKEVLVKNNNTKITVSSSKSSKVIATLKKDTKVTIYDTGSAMWKTIKIDGKTGYILTNEVKDIPATNAKPSSSSSSSSSKNSTGTITTNGLRVRKGPGTSYAILTKLYKGDNVTIVEKNKNGWTKISYKNYTGYVSSDYVKVDSSSNSSSSSSSSSSSKNSTGTITTNGLRVRKGPGTSYAILTKLYKGDNVTIVEKNKNGWTKISYGKYTGYVSSDYIKL